MMEWLIVLLVLSVVLNYFLGGAYIKLLKEYNQVMKMKNDLEKIYGSIDKIVSDRKRGKR